MHSQFNRLLTLLAILICLPLQGLAALTMTCCQSSAHETEMHAVAEVVVQMTHCDHHHDGNTRSDKSPCDKCFACYLSAAQALIPLAMPVKALGTMPLVAGLVKEFQNQVPAPLFHPPRPTFA